MKIAIAGTRSFGCAVLEAVLKDGHEIAHVFSPPGDKLAERAQFVHRISTDNHVTAARLAALRVDVLVAAHSHSFIGVKSRQSTRLGAFGYHPSLLPLHRGKDAVRWTVRDRDRIAGGSTYWLNDTVDGGDIAAQDWCFVRPEWSAQDLWAERLFPMGVDLIRRTLDDLDRNVIVAVPQDHTLATVEPSFDAPRLYRPELPQIGGGPAGYTILSDSKEARRDRSGGRI